jgi:serine protease AprX
MINRALTRHFYILLLSAGALFFLSSVTTSAQTAPGKYWIRFTDKNNSPYSLSHPEEFLSQKTIERRIRNGVTLDSTDLPVNQSYIDGVLSAGPCWLHHKSKWFNSITIFLVDSLVINSIMELPFVAEVRSVVQWHDMETLQAERSIHSIAKEEEMLEWNGELTDTSGIYGTSFDQIGMMNGHVLHELGFTGKGVDVAILDAGWSWADKLPAFEKIRNESRIVMTRDYVFELNDPVYSASNHGMYVLSTMAGIIPDSLYGTAPDANFYLFRTEDPGSEYLVEEDNWVAAAEFCDSLGIDLINSSLGYSLFDDSTMNHTYADMNGRTTRISIGADMAARKGILVVNSAGNSGASAWHYITAPSDGDNVLCVGAVGANRLHAPFSSFGPSSDGDVKPNVCAMGLWSVVASPDSTILIGNGTSFSSPILAGLAACLIQAFPEKSNMEIFRAIEKSADLYNNPNDSLGYGIPDFWKAFQLLQQDNLMLEGELNASLFPNPCNNYLNLVIQDKDVCKVEYEIFDASGRLVYSNDGFVLANNEGVLQLNEALVHLTNGTYLIRLNGESGQSVISFVVDKN